MAALGRCRSCNQPVRFATTAKGKLMPVDPEPTGQRVGLERIGEGNLRLEGDRVYVLRGDDPHEGPVYTSHFATCPHSRQWSKGRAPKRREGQ